MWLYTWILCMIVGHFRFNFEPDCLLHRSPHTMSDAAGSEEDSHIVVSASGSSTTSTRLTDKPGSSWGSSSDTPTPGTWERDKNKDKYKVIEPSKEERNVGEKKMPMFSHAVSCNGHTGTLLLMTSCVLVCFLVDLLRHRVVPFSWFHGLWNVFVWMWTEG